MVVRTIYPLRRFHPATPLRGITRNRLSQPQVPMSPASRAHPRPVAGGIKILAT